MQQIVEATKTEPDKNTYLVLSEQHVALPHPTAYSLGYLEYLGGAATHHLRLLLMPQ